ncbi:VOC family protein [Paenarthrobacter sp. DKR-5]|uniref:VOC family protein n=1 Tax=Paenarthrobacter sp. DKR-5 TaxID=2835535 RepID=UPI001BDD1EB3|nr:VOC family protein [Paenarthrobacter sp. DKR-5]MBT1001888.1 VOC family protein [Paenarthrobacter sp. DKR-5]
METWTKGIDAITLFTEDLAATKAFYGEVFGLPVMFEDENSVVFNFGNTLINLLESSAATELISPANVGGANEGSRLQLTLGVPDVDAACAELVSRGVELLNGPMDRPWGIRTASFKDPGGHIWEIAH